MTAAPAGRRLVVGAEWQGPGAGVDFRVWAPKRRKVDVIFESGLPALVLDRDPCGYFRGRSAAATVGSRYRFRLDEGRELFPDPASRFQPHGPHGPSEVIDPGAFQWTDGAWRGTPRDGQILYEMHIGTFTREGTWSSAATQLPELARLGVTLLEVMPIAEFPGRFGWGYDGVDLFAPTRLYGTPDCARRFVDTAHGLGLGVILDVVYNHLGPAGNYLGEFSAFYFSQCHKTNWGPGINYDGEGSAAVRDLIATNAAYWVEEFHFDGLRMDATQDIRDTSDPHILLEIGRAVRRAAKGRATFLAAENESQDARLVRSTAKGGYEVDALWNDDFHHSARVALTNRSEAYYGDYGGTPQELISALKWGYLYQGQYYEWQARRRGTPSLDVHPASFITFLENHDQVANSARGERLRGLTSPGRHRAFVALLLLGPSTPLIFQGEEFASSSPFVFFADHETELAKLVKEGRREFLSQFPSIRASEILASMPTPEGIATFERCKLDFSERATHEATYLLYRDLIALRRTDPVLRKPRLGGMDGAVLSSSAFVLRFFGEAGKGDRLLLVNIGADLALTRASEPLLAPPERSGWTLAWSSESARYGGGGTPPIERDGRWRVPGESTALMTVAEVAI